MHAYVMNLPSRKDRHDNIVKRLANLDITYEFIYGVQHNEKVKKHKAINDDHIIAFDKAQDRGEHAFIMEDDAVFCSKFDERLAWYLENAPADWDILYLGFIPLNNWSPQLPPSQAVFKLTGQVIGSFSYIVNNKALDVVRKTFESSANVSDGILNELQRSLNCYGILPLIAKMDANYSDTSHAHVSFPQTEKIFDES